jgi:hypothetical protein
METHSVLACMSVRMYIDGLRPKETEDPASLCSLVPRRVSQSTNIRLGNELEKIINYLADAHSPATDLRPKKTTKGGRQLDFARLRDGRVEYAEFKSNINLDTEKRKATREKVNSVAAALAVEHGCEVRPYLVTLRYLRTDDVPAAVRGSYGDVNLIGVADFCASVIGVRFAEMESYEAYSALLLAIVDRLEPV